ncbi:mammalian cell entry protein [Mycobacteroides franklinii]|uniref:Mammalian cell entry protein n=1 Tax=Mycobacteroides franklinii TaxID=948102 RepID=A0A1S1LDL4_9MYCO|nr:MlaD family protein [Mycobacteroides franklinii]OHU31091.1 mammalian cell entry protein [Mycobacteroides franklinii]
MATRKRMAALGMAALVTGTALSGCSTNGLGDLPLPAPGVGTGGYHLTALFSNILNLPNNAKVKLAGADVGQVDDMRVSNYTAITTLRILDGVRLPKGSTAELRSATPLGDVFVSIRPPAGATSDSPILREGDTIGLDSTMAAATVESVLSSAAIVSNGGAVRNLTNVINGFGKATGDQGQAFGDLIKDSNRLLGTLNTRSAQISDALTQTSRLADQLDTKNQALTDIVKEADPATEALAANTAQLSQLVLQIGATTKQLQKFPSIAGTDTSGHSLIKDANTVAKAWNDVAQDPTVDINNLNRQITTLVKSTPSNAISVRVSIDRLVLGSIPDAGFKGDVGSHGPKRYNWAQLVGSFKYTLWRLQERVVGKGVYGDDVPMRPSPTEPGVIERVPGPPPGAVTPAPSNPGAPVPPPPGQAVPASAPAPGAIPAPTSTPTPAPAPAPGPAPGPEVMGQ